MPDTVPPGLHGLTSANVSRRRAPRTLSDTMWRHASGNNICGCCASPSMELKQKTRLPSTQPRNAYTIKNGADVVTSSQRRHHPFGGPHWLCQYPALGPLKAYLVPTRHTVATVESSSRPTPAHHLTPVGKRGGEVVPKLFDNSMCLGNVLAFGKNLKTGSSYDMYAF